MRRVWWTVLTLAALAPVLGAQTPAAPRDLGALLTRIGAAVEQYYARAQSIMCLEEVVLRMLGYDMSSSLPPRRLTYDLRVAWSDSLDGAAPEAVVQRELLRINNRAPRERDKPQCLDPVAVSPDTLQMLLPHNQADYTFTPAGSGRVDGRAALMIDYVPRERGDVTVKTHEGREECWSVDFPGYQRGRVWIDAETSAVLRVDERLSRMVNVTLPSSKSRHEPLPVVFERVDSSTIFRAVHFKDPDESVMLPHSVEETIVVRNAGVPRTRTSRRFTNYRRFTTDARIIEQP
jgi:hypothetical protein